MITELIKCFLFKVDIMDGQIFQLFATPLYTHKLENEEYAAVQNEMQVVVDELYATDHWKQNLHWNSNSQYLSNQGNFNESILDSKDMKHIKAAIMHHCLNYMSMMSVHPKYKAAIETSWLTLTKPGLASHIHDHGNSHISGVYWFKTNGKDGDIVFRNSFKSLKCHPLGTWTAHESSFSPDQGRLVLFPGFLDHSVNENQTMDDRISLSFNIVLETGLVS
jgi:uncharacterized protein (TIGR02466 family)